MSFLVVQIIREDQTFTNSVYRKPTFSRVYTHFDSFLPSIYKFLILFTHSLIDGPKYAQVGLNLKKGCHGNFINKCFERFMDKVYVIKESTLTVEQEPLFLPSPSIPRFKILTN